MQDSDIVRKEGDFKDEHEFQLAVEGLADRYGWKAQHFQQRDYLTAKEEGKRMPRGIPDLVLSMKIEGQDQPVIMLAELKTDTSNLDHAQEAFLNFFCPTIACFLWRPRNLEWIEDILKHGPPEPTGFIIEESNSPPISTEVLIPDRSVVAIVSDLVHEISKPNFPRGDLAGLRRMNPDDPKPAAFLKVMGKVGYPQDPGDETKWALILHGIALMTPNAHDKSTPVGKALFLGGDSSRKAGQGFYSSSRLNKLLNARGNARRALLARVFRMMARASKAFNWYEMADFILNENQEVASELSRRRIAREYYRTEGQSPQ